MSKGNNIEPSKLKVDKEALKYVKKEETEKPLAEHTRKMYKRAVDLFNKAIEYDDLQVNRNSIKKFLKFLKEAYAPSTARVYKNGLQKAILRQFGEDKITKRTAIKELFNSVDLPTPDRTIRESDYINEMQVYELVKEATPKSGLLILFLFKTGLRVSEMINITLNDCEVYDEDKVRIRIIAKGEKERYVVISKELFRKIEQVYHREAPLLESIKAEYEDEKLLFPELADFLFQSLKETYLFQSKSGKKLHRVNVTKQIKRVGKKLGLDITAQTLRHSRATDLIEKGVTLPEIQSFLVHARVNTTESMYIQNEIDFSKMDKREKFDVSNFKIKG